MLCIIHSCCPVDTDTRLIGDRAATSIGNRPALLSTFNRDGHWKPVILAANHFHQCLPHWLPLARLLPPAAQLPLPPQAAPSNPPCLAGPQLPPGLRPCGQEPGRHAAHIAFGLHYAAARTSHQAVAITCRLAVQVERYLEVQAGSWDSPAIPALVTLSSAPPAAPQCHPLPNPAAAPAAPAAPAASGRCRWSRPGCRSTRRGAAGGAAAGSAPPPPARPPEPPRPRQPPRQLRRRAAPPGPRAGWGCGRGHRTGCAAQRCGHDLLGVARVGVGVG